MNASSNRSHVVHRPWIGRPRRQKGGETVEFALLAVLIFLVFFGLIEFSIAMYDQGTLVHASRVGAREASLYWLDVNQITPESDPENDQRIRPSAVNTAISDFADRFMVSFTGDTTDKRLFNQSIASLPSTVVVSAGDPIPVDLSLRYRAPVTRALAGLLDINMAAHAEMRVE